LREHLHVHWRRQPIFIADHMFELPTQPPSIVLEIANFHAKILMKQDDDDTDWEISENKSEDPGVSTLWSDIEEDDLDHQPEVLYLHQARRDKAIWTTSVPPPIKRSCADTVIECTSLPNLRHLAGTIPPPLLKLQKWTINIICESDVVSAQALPLPKTGGDQNGLQPKAGRDHNVPQHQEATLEVAKRFIEAIMFTNNPWPIICDEKYSLVAEDWKLAIDAQDCQRALAGALVGTPSVCQLPSGPSLEIDPQTWQAVSVNSGFYSSIGVMMILNPRTIHS